MPLLNYQIPFAERLLRIHATGNISVDTSDTGTGKTYVALHLAKQYKTLVITPKANRTQFTRAAEAEGVPLLGVFNIEKLKAGNTPFLKRMKSGPQRFAWDLSPGTLLIIDEVQKMSGMTSDNADILALTKAYGIRTHLMSATMAESPLKMRAIGYLLGLNKYGLVDFLAWCRERGVKENPYNQRLEFTRNPAERVRILSELHTAMAPKMVRMRIAEIPDFPSCEIYPELFDLDQRSTAELNGLYDALREEVRNPQAKTQEVHLLRLRQQAEMMKVGILFELVEEGIEEGKSMVVFTNFRDTQAELAKRLTAHGIMPGRIYGGQSDNERQAFIDAFQNGLQRVILVMIQAGGVALSLHDTQGEHPREALICPGWSATEFKQTLGRVWRAGAKSKAIQKVVLCAGTVEENVYKTLKRKVNNIDLLNDGDLQELS
jgi:hypothetical protein